VEIQHDYGFPQVLVYIAGIQAQSITFQGAPKDVVESVFADLTNMHVDVDITWTLDAAVDRPGIWTRSFGRPPPHPSWNNEA
jgi:hypothetical protein